LDALQQDYEALKAVKEEIVIKDVSKKIDEVQKKGGVPALQSYAKDTALEIQALTNKMKEFPDD